MMRLTSLKRRMFSATSVSRSTQSKPATMAWRSRVWRASSLPSQRPPSAMRRTVATIGQGLLCSRRLKSGAFFRKSRRSSRSRAPRLPASWISICTILCRVRPMTTQRRSRARPAGCADFPSVTVVFSLTTRRSERPNGSSQYGSLLYLPQAGRARQPRRPLAPESKGAIIGGISARNATRTRTPPAMRPALPLALGLTAVALLSLVRSEEKLPPLVAPTDPRSPAEEKKTFHLPPGFDIELVAAEPDIHKPMNLAFDDRGRLWVTDTIEYPYPAPPGRKPRDTVKVLEDFGSDGRARKITTFADGLNIPIGVLPLTGSAKQGDEALVFSIPAIRRFRDSDRDGKADKSEVLYEKYGFGDTHGMTSAFTWGPGGWVYACHGFSNTSTVRAKDGSQVTMQSGNTYRFRPDGSHIEQITWGQVNPFV